MKKFPAFRIHSDQQGAHAGIEQLSIDDLCEGDVVIRVQYSSVNYKDALAGTGKAQILRRSPLVGGIDLAGEVIESSSDDFVQGDQVIVNGSGLSEIHDGGYAEFARVPADWVVLLPGGLTLAQSIGDDVFVPFPYYTKTELNTSGAGGAVHWDNVTNKPTIPAAQVNSDWNAST